MVKTHYDIIKDVSNEGWDFNPTFVRDLLYPKPEKKDKHPLAYALGADVEKTGKHFCLDCGEYLTDQACSGFEDVVRNTLRREVIEPYMERHCPECENKIEDTTPVEEYIPEDNWTTEPSEASFSNDWDIEIKTRYEPCGCLHERGEEQILWDINKDKAEQEVDILRFSGRIFNS